MTDHLNDWTHSDLYECCLSDLAGRDNVLTFVVGFLGRDAQWLFDSHLDGTASRKRVTRQIERDGVARESY